MSVAGLSKPRLERMHRVLSGYVERNELPGPVALVSRHDDVHVETLGTMSMGDPAPMKRDTLIRIASITKPVTAVADCGAVRVEVRCSRAAWRYLQLLDPSFATGRSGIDLESATTALPS